jgi:hypothetical protein
MDLPVPGPIPPSLKWKEARYRLHASTPRPLQEPSTMHHEETYHTERMIYRLMEFRRETHPGFKQRAFVRAVLAAAWTKPYPQSYGKLRNTWADIHGPSRKVSMPTRKKKSETITFKGKAARAAFTALTGVAVPAAAKEHVTAADQLRRVMETPAPVGLEYKFTGRGRSKWGHVPYTATITFPTEAEAIAHQIHGVRIDRVTVAHSGRVVWKRDVI